MDRWRMMDDMFIKIITTSSSRTRLSKLVPPLLCLSSISFTSSSGWFPFWMLFSQCSPFAIFVSQSFPLLSLLSRLLTCLSSCSICVCCLSMILRTSSMVWPFIMSKSRSPEDECGIRSLKFDKLCQCRWPEPESGLGLQQPSRQPHLVLTLARQLTIGGQHSFYYILIFVYTSKKKLLFFNKLNSDLCIYPQHTPFSLFVELVMVVSYIYCIRYTK